MSHRSRGHSFLSTWKRHEPSWGRMVSCGRLSIGLPVGCTSLQEGRLTIGLQDTILPHKSRRAKFEVSKVGQAVSPFGPRLSLTLAVLLCLPALAQHGAVNPAFFATKVYPILESAQCRACHATDGVASGTRLHFPEKDSSQTQIQLFGLSLAPLVDRSNSSQSLLLVKPTNRLRHTGVVRAHPASDAPQPLPRVVD